ncbi:MAG: 2-hydroxyacid dehydrogenase [Eubacteriales bacterium]
MNNKKIVFYDTKPYDISSFEKAEHENITYKFLESKLTADTALLAKGADAVCAFVNDTIDKEVIDILYDLGIRAILMRCAGYNNVDIHYTYKKIHIFNVPAYSPYAVAEHAMALLLTLNRKTHKAYARVRDNNFSINGLCGMDLIGKSIGVIGTGKIGQIFIDICKGFGMNILAYDKFPKEGLGVEYVGLEELYKRSHIISLHCPLNNETHHMINSDSIAMMKEGVIILNTSRGGLIDTVALIEGLKSKKLGGAALDVYEEEMNYFFEDYSEEIISDDVLSRLLTFPNVLITSHQAFLTNEALANIADTTVMNFREYQSEEYFNNEICYHCLKRNGKCIKEEKGRCF